MDLRRGCFIVSSLEPKRVLVDELKRRLKEKVVSGEKNIDILESFQDYLLEAQELAIAEVYEELIIADPRFFEDPNSIIRQTYPVVDRGSSKARGKITFDDIRVRNPYTQTDLETLKKSCVGFLGFGGMQSLGMLLVRTGLGNLVIVDPDKFESSNANRQAFCFSDTLGRYKVDVAKEFLERANSEVNVVAERYAVTEENIDPLFQKAQVIIDSSGDLEARKLTHRYGKGTGKPIITAAWAGNEGMYLTLFPEDPSYFDLFGHTPYNPERGNHPSGLAALSSLISNDTIRILAGDTDSVVRYPYITIFNMESRAPVKLRRVEHIIERGRRCLGYE